MALGRAILQDPLAGRPRLRPRPHRLQRPAGQARPRGPRRRPVAGEKSQRRFSNRSSGLERNPQPGPHRPDAVPRDRVQPRVAPQNGRRAQSHAALRSPAPGQTLQARPPQNRPSARQDVIALGQEDRPESPAEDRLTPARPLAPAPESQTIQSGAPVALPPLTSPEVTRVFAAPALGLSGAPRVPQECGQQGHAATGRGVARIAGHSVLGWSPGRHGKRTYYGTLTVPTTCQFEFNALLRAA